MDGQLFGMGAKREGEKGVGEGMEKLQAKSCRKKLIKMLCNVNQVEETFSKTRSTP